MVLLAAIAGAGPADALPAVGAKLPSLTVNLTDKRSQALPLPRLPLLVLYEDKDAGKQNVKAQVIIGTFTDNVANKDKFTMFAVADVEKWNFWPARGYVLADIREVAKTSTVPILIDWKGALRRSWGLKPGKSSILLVLPDGEVRFAAEGTLSEAQTRELVQRLVELGAAPIVR